MGYGALAAILALNTSMRGCEVKGLRWRDVDFMERTITIRRSKTVEAERVIPLNVEAWVVILSLRRRAENLFGDKLESRSYVFPHAEGYSKPDPSRPMTGWRSAWRSLTRAIQCPACNQLQQPAETCSNEEKSARPTFAPLRVPCMVSGFTICATKRLPSWPKVRRASEPSWQLQGASRRRCWTTTATFG